MSGRHRVAVALLALPLLVGCAAGRDSQTSITQAVGDAAETDLGDLQVRNLYLAAPEGSTYSEGDDAPLYLTVASRSRSADSLISVTSPDARSVAVVPAGAEATPSADNTSASPSAGAGIDSRTTAAELPIEIRGGSALTLGPDSTHLVLQGLVRQLRPSQYVQVTLTFATAGSTTLNVPVELRADTGAQ